MKAGDYIKAVKGAMNNQPFYWAKHHNDRVLADGGTVTDKTPEGQRSHLADYYKFLRETRLIDNLVFSWDSSSGIKERTSGVNVYATKAYTANREVLGSEIVPNNKFEINDVSFFDYTLRCTKEYNPTEKCLRLIGTTNGDNVVFGKYGALTVGKLYRIEFDIKSSNTNNAIPALQAGAFSNINVIQAVQLSSTYQTFIAEGISTNGYLGLYAAHTNGMSGATYDVDNISVKEIVIPEFKDAVQATEANQPFVGGGIAPNEKKRLKNLSQASTRGLTHTQISFSATDNWSVTTVLKGFENIYPQSTGMYAGDISTGRGLYLYRAGNRIALFNGVNEYSTNDITSFLNSNIGKSMIVTWMYTANAVLLFVNGVQMTTISTFSQFNFVFNVLFQNVSGQRNLAGEIYYHQIFNKALSASEVQAQHAYLRLQHPEIEGINIGNQHWATSNYEGVVTGNGTVIPEVQNATTVNVLTGGNFESGLIGTVSFGTGSGSWTLNTSSPISGVQDGLLQVTSVDTNQYRPLLNFPMTRKQNYRYKLSFDYKVNSGTVKFKGYHKGNSTNLFDMTLSGNGTYTVEYTCDGDASGLQLYFDGRNLFNLQIDNIKNEELGWADLTTPAWCYYNNDPLNGAVYGKEYNAYATLAIKSNPPAGWRVPTDADFNQLKTYLGSTDHRVYSSKLSKEGLKYWSSAYGTNETGFSAISSGIRLQDGTFPNMNNVATIGNGTSVLQISNEVSTWAFHAARGFPIRLIRNEPVGATERTVETGYITNALGATNLDISIPFGYQVESVRIDSETNITGLSAKLHTGALTELETLFTAKSVTANVQKVIAADADQSIQQTDAVVRINGTKANTAARFRVWIKLTKVVFS